jgi:ABC-type Fe3+/spermidine/putrescine transport system ATPase subunit
MLLEVANLDAFYGDLQALHGLNIEVERGESVALVGANGAGKTTFVRCLAGLIEQKRGAITFGGNDVSRMPAEAIARRGIALVPEGRMLFPSLNVEENLLMGALGQRPGYWDLQRVFGLFPLLAERRRQMPNTPGGQQGLVAIGRALMANPDLLLCDEISRSRGRSDLRFVCPHPCRGRRHRCGRTGRQTRGLGDRPHLLPFGGTRRAAGAKPKARCRRAHSRLFRHLTQVLEHDVS